MATTQRRLTNRQQEILKLLYSYRFLTRTQLQALLHHKDHKHINTWLKYLRDNNYIAWIYSTDYVGRTKPAVYYLAINGIRYLRNCTITDEHGAAVATYPTEELNKRYREAARGQAYIDRCLAVADWAIEAAHLPDGTNYHVVTEADYRVGGPYNFLADCGYVRPQLVLRKQLCFPSGRKRPAVTYLLEVCQRTLPRSQVLFRARQYVRFFETREWEGADETRDPEPGVLFVCYAHGDMVAAKQSARRRLDEAWDDSDKDRPLLMFATVEMIRAKGMFEEIWAAA